MNLFFFFLRSNDLFKNQMQRIWKFRCVNRFCYAWWFMVLLFGVPFWINSNIHHNRAMKLRIINSLVIHSIPLENAIKCFNFISIFVWIFIHSFVQSEFFHCDFFVWKTFLIKIEFLSRSIGGKIWMSFLKCKKKRKHTKKNWFRIWQLFTA